MKELEQAIKLFREAQSRFKAAEDSLNEALNPHLQKCSSISDYQKLLDILPARYHGTRRIYEAIIRIEDNKP